MRAIGIDPALGGGFALIVCELGDHLIVLDFEVHYELSKTEEQLFFIERLAREYRPNVVIIEFDAQQKGLGNDDRLKAMSHKYGFSIRPHITRGQKMDEIFGVASMDQTFKQRQISIPYGDEDTIERMRPLIHQLRTWRPDVKTKNLVQDAVMALWFVWRFWMKTRKEAGEPALTPAFRPSWVMQEAPYRGIAV